MAKRRSSVGAPVGQYDHRIQREVIQAGEVLDLNGNRAHTIALAQACRRNCFIRQQRTLIDFSGTKKISSSATLYLVAEMDRCRKLSTPGLLTGTYPKDKKLHRQLRDTGFYEALGVSCTLDDSEKTYPLEYIKVMAGTGAEGRLARELRQKLLGPHEVDLARDTRSSMFRGLSEAMTNVTQHAYPADWKQNRVKWIPSRWWMLGHINKLRKELKIMIVDQGIGIPRSLPRKHTMETIREVLSLIGIIQPTDGQMISAAMEVGRSRMGETNRGKGLNDLKNIIDLCGDGRLRILSNRGEFIYFPKREAKSNSYAESMAGTLIEWTIPLSAILPLVNVTS
ncbi:hypothetical protein [Cupriavidus oxalaticus]|jgi:hypothetical protein|uniref:hypothetical protein n=1 Tax=Cupriavidus oxalaticus TaxID=96344 RepID=UPI004033338E